MDSMSMDEAFATLDRALSDISTNRRSHILLQECLAGIQKALADAQARVKELEGESSHKE